MTTSPDAAGTGSTPALPWIDAATVLGVAFADAADAVDDALAGGLDVSADPPRAIVPVTAGQLLIMPGELPGYAGVKIVGVAPENPASGLPRILGSYLLLDGATLRPLAVLDGSALTTLRTPAVSAVAARYLAAPGACRLLVFGAGPQAAGHIRALQGVRPLAEVVVVGRTRSRAAALAAGMRDELGIDARAGDVHDVAGADIVVCATTAAEPLFVASAVARHALVIAVGSHQPGVLEFDPDLLAGSQVVVEDRATALREAGEVVAAVAAGSIDPARLIGLTDIVTGTRAPDLSRPRVFKSVGMGWEDLVVAVRVFRRQGSGEHRG